MSSSGSGSHLSKELLDLVKSIGESRSKQEEDKIISAEATSLKQKFLERNVQEKKMKELLIRAIYVEMLGHDASFSYIHAVNLTQSKNLLIKRIGYLACQLFIDNNSELIILMIATIQKDLQSKSHLEVLAALTCLTKLANAQIVVAVQDAVDQLLKHEHEMIRKKAVIVMIKFNQISHIDGFEQKMKQALCDRDPSVMAASLCHFVEAVKKQPQNYKDLVPSFLIIIKQVTEHRLPRDFDYHRMPAPWIQTKLLEIVAALGADDQESSAKMYDMIQLLLKKADDMGINIGYALVYQCLKTITTIYPHQPLIDLATLTISRFLSSESNNLKYIGITGLASIVKIDPKYTLNYQGLVVDCLESTDETLKIKTLDLLYKMTNKQNVEPIVERLLNYLKEAPIEAGSRKDLVQKISSLGERFAPNQNWYVRNMNKLFEIGGSQITQELINQFISAMSEYEREKETSEQMNKFRDSTIKIYVKILRKNQNISDALMQVIAWMLGEYGSITQTNTDTEKVNKTMNLLAQFAHGNFENERTRASILLAITKLHASLNFVVSEQIELIMNDYVTSKIIEVQERAFEYQILSKNSSVVPSAILFKVPMTETQISQDNFDFDLSFLDGAIQQQLSEGKPDYDPEKANFVTAELGGLGIEVSGLNFTPYQQASIGVTKHSSNLQQSNPMFVPQNQKDSSNANAAVEVGGVKVETLKINNVKKVWGSGPDPNEQQESGEQKAPDFGVGNTTNASNNNSAVGGVGNNSGAVQQNMGSQNSIAKTVVKDPVQTKQDKKKAQIQNALFAGIRTEDKSDDSDSSDDSPKKQEAQPTAVLVQAPQVDLMNLLDMPNTPIQNQQQQVQPQLNLLDLDLGMPQQQQPVQQQPVALPYRPTQFQTSDFGQLWGQNAMQNSVEMTIGAIQTPQLFKQALESTLGFQVIEIIQNEIIASANEGQVLLHTRVLSADGHLLLAMKTATNEQLVQLQGDINRLTSFGQVQTANLFGGATSGSSVSNNQLNELMGLF